MGASFRDFANHRVSHAQWIGKFSTLVPREFDIGTFEKTYINIDKMIKGSQHVSKSCTFCAINIHEYSISPTSRLNIHKYVEVTMLGCRHREAEMYCCKSRQSIHGEVVPERPSCSVLSREATGNRGQVQMQPTTTAQNMLWDYRIKRDSKRDYMEQTISENINLEISFRDPNMSLVRTVNVDSDKTISRQTVSQRL